MSSDLKNWLDESAEKREEKIANLETKLRDQEATIAELKKKLSYALTMGDKDQIIRSLEQQATACDWIYKNVSDLSNGNYKAIKSRSCQLKNKAKALKDPS